MLKHQGNCTCSCKGIYVLRGVTGMQREFTLPAYLHANGKSFHDNVKRGSKTGAACSTKSRGTKVLKEESQTTDTTS